MHHAGTVALGNSGQNAHGFSVEPCCQRFVVLGGVNGGIGRTVDDVADGVVCHHLLNGRFIGDVQGDDVIACHIGENSVKVRVIGQHIAHLVSQLAVSASDEYIGCCHGSIVV